MAGLADLIDLAPVETPVEAYYAQPLMQASRGFSGYDYPINRNFSNGDIFALEALKGLGGGVTGVLGQALAGQAQAEVNAKRLSLARELMREDANTELKAQIVKSGLDNGTISASLDDKGNPVFSVADALKPDYGKLGLTSEQQAALDILPIKDRRAQAAKYVGENQRQDNIDDRQEKAGRTGWANVGLTAAEKSQVKEAPVVGKQGLELTDSLKMLVPKYNAVEWWASKDINGTDAQRLNSQLMLWAQRATRLFDVGALTEGDKKTLQEIASGKGTWFARPSTLFPLIDRVSRGLIGGAAEKMEAAKTIHEKGGDALLSELRSLEDGSTRVDARQGVSIPQKPKLSFEEFKRLRAEGKL